MRREWYAGALLLFLILGAAWNLRTADRLLSGVESSLCRAELAARQGAYEEARRELERGRQLWNKNDTYTQIFFRHADLDDIQDAFFALEGYLRQKDPAWPAALAQLRYHLETVDRMEHLTPEAIF